MGFEGEFLDSLVGRIKGFGGLKVAEFHGCYRCDVETRRTLLKVAAAVPQSLIGGIGIRRGPQIRLWDRRRYGRGT